MIIICPKLKEYGIYGLAIYPFIFIHNSESILDKELINHEKIHLQQELELLIIPFYIIYGINWIVNYFKYKSWEEAYRNIIFEREAYQNDYNLNYLKNRRMFSFIKYLKK